MSNKKNKVRTSITIDPDLLASIRFFAKDSVSSYVERALVNYIEHHEVENQKALTDEDV